jgi:probable rRNA maturation factor
MPSAPKDRPRSPRPKLSVAIAEPDPSWSKLAPEAPKVLRRAARRAFAAATGAGWRGSKVAHEVSFMLTDDRQMRRLNRDYRGKDKPTNVLSFAALDAAKPKPSQPWLLGDIVLASGVIAREAKEQAKTLEQHLTHMAVHGMLHLLGYDHDDNHDAEIMEALEISALAKMGIANPYESHR